MLHSLLVELFLQFIDLGAQGANSGISIFLDLFDADDLSLESLCLLEQLFIHLLDLVTLHLVLFLERQVLI